jgi:hypothetical protein
MDCADDSPVVFSGKVTKGLHHRCCCERVKTSGGLIEENQAGVSDKLDTNAGSLALTT